MLSERSGGDPVDLLLYSNTIQQNIAYKDILNTALPGAEGGARNSSGTEGSRAPFQHFIHTLFGQRSRYGVIPKYEPKKSFKENDIPARLESLTRSEARQIALYKGPDSFRAAITKECDTSRVGTGETVFSKKVREAPLSDHVFIKSTRSYLCGQCSFALAASRKPPNFHAEIDKLSSRLSSGLQNRQYGV